MSSKKDKTTLASLIFWSVALLALLAGSFAAPWAVFIHIGPTWGLLAGIVIVVPWVFAVQYQPAGINIGPFAVPILFNAGAVLVSWILWVI